MKLVEVHLDGFGLLVIRAFRFAPGFNLIFGPNESGKSTLQQAMLALLYGFWGEGRVTSAQRSILEVVRPWDETAPYEGSLIYRLDDERTFRIFRTFAPRLFTSLTTYPGGQDVSSQFKRASRGRLLFADAQLGMSKQVFENTCYVRQAELVALQTSANAITDTLMRLSASASMDTTASDAVALLEKAIKEQVGTPRSRKRPLPLAQAKLSRLEQEQTQALQTRRELNSQIVELNQSEERLQQLDLQRQKLRYLRALAERDALRQRQSTLDEVEAEIERYAAEVEKWASWADFPVALRDDVVRLTHQRRRLKQECADLKPWASKAQKQLEELKTQIEEGKAQVQALAGAKDVPTAELGPLRKMINQFDLAYAQYYAAGERWQKSQSALDQAEGRAAQERETLSGLLELGYAGLAKLQQQLVHCSQKEQEAAEALRRAQEKWSSVGISDEGFEELKRTVQAFQADTQTPPPRRGCSSLFISRSSRAAKLLPPEPNIYAQVAPIYERRAQARVELQSAKAARSEAEREARKRLGRFVEGPLNDGAFRRLEERIANRQRLLADVEQKKREVADAKAEANKARKAYVPLAAALKAKLEALGLDISDPHKALDEFERQCERRLRLEREQASLKQLRLEAEALFRDVQALADKRSALREAEAALCETLAKAGMECTPAAISDAVARFEEGVKNHGRWNKAHTAYQSAISRRDTVVSEQSTEDLSAALATVENTIAEVQFEHPDWANLPASRPRQEYDPLIREADEAWSSERENHRRLLEAVQSAYSHRHPAEIDEDIAETREAIARLERFRDALELARGELEAATQEFQKQFAPRVERLMSEGLAQATQGRYSKVQVHPTSLDVSLVAPELGRAVSVEHLSTGTRDLVYLMLRVAIARLMSRTGEKLPLLLDDPLVQCDRARLEQTLGFLAQLAGETQVFLFTKDEWTEAWFQKHLGSHSRHSLHVLS